MLKTVLATAAVLSLAACGSTAPTPTTNSPATASTTAASTTTAASPAAAPGNGCNDAAVDAVKKAETAPSVKSVQVIGGCSMLSIETSLGPTAKSEGVAICEAAAKVAYTGSISSVSVDGSDGHELAAGIKGQPCI